MGKSFVSLIGNARYQVGCTGQTVYVMDTAGNELAKFKDIKYAYYPALHPGGEIAAVYSNEGIMAVYSLSKRQLIRKFRVSAEKDTQTDRVPCFSPDGKYLYHIEGRKGDCFNSRLSVYSTADYRPVIRLFEQGQKTVFVCMEFDVDSGSLFLLGYFRGEKDNEHCEHFVAQLSEQSLQNVKLLDRHTFDFYYTVIRIKQSGYTQYSYTWSNFTIISKIKEGIKPSSEDHEPRDWGYFDRTYTLNDLKQMDLSLAKLWELS